MTFEYSTQVYNAICARFAAPAWAVLPEVRNGTGFARGPRTADAVAMSLWPSRGLELHGFEIKVSRYDWLKELKNPEKSEEIQRFCDRWWVAVGDESIIEPGELPSTWGLLVPSKKGLRVSVEAPRLEAQPITRLFLASLLKQVAQAEDARVNELVEAKYSHALEENKRRFESQLEIDQKIRDQNRVQAERDIADFERVSGVKITTYNGGHIGRAVKRVLENTDPGAFLNRFVHMRDMLRGFLAETDKVFPLNKEDAA